MVYGTTWFTHHQNTALLFVPAKEANEFDCSIRMMIIILLLLMLSWISLHSNNSICSRRCSNSSLNRLLFVVVPLLLVYHHCGGGILRIPCTTCWGQPIQQLQQRPTLLRKLSFSSKGSLLLSSSLSATSSMNDNGSPTTDLIVLSPSDSSDTSIGGMGGTISDEIEMLLNHEHEIKKQHQHDEQQQEHSKNDEPTKLSGSCNPLKGSNQHYFMSDWYITELNNTQYFHSYTKLNDFLEGPALEIYDNDIDERNNKKLLTRAVCLFRNQIRFSNHFPHAMQQLYRCWSWWQSNPSIPPVLIWSTNTNGNNYQQYMQNNPYVAEFLVVLQEQYNLTIMETQNVDVAKQKRNQNKKQKKKVPYSYYNDSDFTIPPYVYSKNTGLFLDDIELTDFALLRPQHANDLSQLFQQFIHNHCDNITSAASSGNNNGGIQLGGCIAGKSNNYHPKISILNRSTQSKRSILNVDQLLEEIIQSFPNSTVRVEYFEDNKTMIQQAQFFMESDIILSPHGAQLTGIIHQPSYDGCSQIVELLPQDYLVADYFGSLAKAAGVHHSFFYIQTDKRVNDTSTLLEHELPDPYGQHKYHYYASSDYRNYQMCPTTTKLMASMQILVKNWQSCCRSQEM